MSNACNVIIALKLAIVNAKLFAVMLFIIKHETGKIAVHTPTQNTRPFCSY